MGVGVIRTIPKSLPARSIRRTLHLLQERHSISFQWYTAKRGSDAGTRLSMVNPAVRETTWRRAGERTAIGASPLRVSIIKSMDYSFRQVSTDDISTIQTLARIIWNEAYHKILSEDQIVYMLEMMYSRVILAWELSNGIVWELIFYRGNACGFLSYAFAEDNSVKLSKIYIKESFRGKQIADRAIARVVQYASENNRDYVFLTVNKNNKRAIRAYEKNGFTITSSVVTDIGGGFVMDDYIMLREVCGPELELDNN